MEARMENFRNLLLKRAQEGGPDIASWPSKYQTFTKTWFDLLRNFGIAGALQYVATKTNEGGVVLLWVLSDLILALSCTAYISEAIMYVSPVPPDGPGRWIVRLVVCLGIFCIAIGASVFVSEFLKSTLDALATAR